MSPCSVTDAMKPHAVVVPYPSQGHITPCMQLSKVLHSKGFHITFVLTEFNKKRLVNSKGLDFIKGLPDFRFETIPDGLPPFDGDATQEVPSLCDSTRKNCLAPFIELLKKLNSSGDLPRVSCVISDGVMGFGVKAAQELNIPKVQFWTASACSFMCYLQYGELRKKGLIPHTVEDFQKGGRGETRIDWIGGVSNLRLKDIPAFVGTSNDELMYDFLGSESENCFNSSAIIFNTFDEFEQEALESIKKITNSPRLFSIGPLPLMERHLPDDEFNSLGSSLWKEDVSCLEWLDKREQNSVVYVNYGSVAFMSETHLREFAWGLANSNHYFLWIIRSDVVQGNSAVLPQEFLREIKGRGLLTSWCPQDKVLAHPAVAVFVTHCGWNSMMETVCHGVPVICWPFFADQQTNCRYACTKWGIGSGVNYDVERGEIQTLVREMMEGKEGNRMKLKALEWKKKAEEATAFGGSSYNDFNSFIVEALSLGANNNSIQ